MELLLVSHRGIASGMKSAIAMVMGPVAEQITAMELTEEEGVGNFSKRLEEYLVTWLSGTGKGLVFAERFQQSDAPCLKQTVGADNHENHRREKGQKSIGSRIGGQRLHIAGS